MGTLRTQRTIQLPELPRSSAQMNDLIKWAGDISRVLDRMNRQMRSDLDEMIMGSVSVDHGGLSGLSDDDHTQYHNNTRGDARYSLLAHNHDSTYATLAHTHASYVTGPSSATGHSVALFDGVTGKLLHDSIGVTARIGDHAFNSDHNIELNAYAASDSYCYVDFIAKVGSDYNSRFIRNGGENGTLDIIQTGTGHTNFSGSVVHFEDTTEATSASAASMVLDGGIGIAKKMYIAGQIVSTLAVGTKPLDVTSTTLCDNLNADLLDGNHASAFAVTAHTHTTIANALTISDTTESSSYTTGALIVSGGIGIAKKTYHGDTTEASSVSAASVVLAGGIGIAKKMYIAGQIVSTLAVGTKPIDVTSTTLCTNLNADLIDGYHASEFSTYLHTHNLLYLSIPVFSSANMLAKTVTTHTTILSICKMDETKIALLYNDSYGKRRLACYEYSSGSWDIVGSYYTINASSICRLTDDRVVVFRTTSYDIECYEFDGSTWSKKGNSYSGSANTRGCAFGDNSIVTVCGTYIRILSFDGTDFSQVGNTYTYSGHSLTHCTATSGTTICVTEHLTFGSDSIGMYEFDGSDWAKVGNSFSTSAIYSVTCLNEAIIALIDFDSELKTYRFNGTDFSHESTLVNFTAGDFPVITSLNGVDIASASTFEAAICYFRFCTIEETSFSMSDITSNDVSTSKHGFCPKLPNDATKYLDGTGAWAQVTDADLSTSDVTTNNASTSKHGFCPKLPNDATKYLDGTGAWEKVTDADLSLSDVSTNNVGTSAHGFAPKAPNDATKFLDGTGAWDTVKDSDIAGTAWTSYVPSLTNITLGTGGTATGYYKRIGKTVHFWAIITFGSSTMAIGGWAAIGLPTAASSSYSSTTPIGVGWMSDASSGKNYPLLIKYDGFIFCYVHGSTYTTLGFVTTGAPFTVANTDTICVSGSYQID